jgi:3-hydroxybutyryl-CoA dehydrogenase
MDITSVGIVGAGQMGNGIAHVFALAGYDVLLNDISEDSLTKALITIEKNLDRQVGRGQDLCRGPGGGTGARRTTLKLSDMGATDLVIEAATEREPVKQAIFDDLMPHLKPTTILTSNTSSISITRLASRTDRPEKFMGLHFMNPVPVMQLVELIRGIATDQDTWETMHAVVQATGQDRCQRRGFPGLHREPHPDPDDQRGGLYAV